MGVLGIFTDFFKQRKRYFFSRQKSVQQEIKEALKGIKAEFEEHLQAINENTNEIQSNYEYLCDIDGKLDKLSERIDKIQLFLKSNSNFVFDSEKVFDVKPLTRTEKEIFIVLYALEDENGVVSYIDIARKTGLQYNLISNYITSMIEKGVPILKKYINNRPYLKLDQEFKVLQAKENILMIDTAQKELVSFENV